MINILKEKRIIILTIITLSIVFFAGYFLRSYFEIISPLPYSPYEMYLESNIPNIFGGSESLDVFTQKIASYPLSYTFAKILGPLNNLYLIYIAGALIIFFLGREISNSNLGGILAFSAYAVSSENLIQYTKNISHSGLSYILIWVGLFFIYRYLTKKEDLYLFLYALASTLAITTYHTGAAAVAVISSVLLTSALHKNNQAESKFIGTLLIIISFYFIWTFTYDIDELFIIKNALQSISLLGWLVTSIGAGVFILSSQRITNRLWITSPYIPLVFLTISAVLIFFPIEIFNPLLILGGEYYYSSTITLNNYLAQALLLHIYLLGCLPLIKKEETRYFIHIWIWALLVIGIGLFAEGYFARIFDYSFPLAFVLFGLYWTKEKRFRKIIVPTTIGLLFISQIIIYNDPFSMRRYYTEEEISAAQELIDSELPKKNIFSDLRTTALFNYLGAEQVEGLRRFRDYEALFYKQELIQPIVNSYNHKSPTYIILSQSMKNIIYDTNFETTPLKEESYEYYRENFPLYRENNLMEVYRISP